MNIHSIILQIFTGPVLCARHWMGHKGHCDELDEAMLQRTQRVIRDHDVIHRTIGRIARC